MAGVSRRLNVMSISFHYRAVVSEVMFVG